MRFVHQLESLPVQAFETIGGSKPVFKVDLETNRAQSAIAATAITLALLVSSPVAARERGTAPPLGYQILCLQQPEQCQGGGASSVNAGRSTLKQLDAVNRAVNRAIRPKADGGGDVWTVGAKSGDCEDYVLAKRQALIAKGFPPSALRIAYVKTAAGEGHALLVVRTNDGDYVLDNLTTSIRKLAASGYRVQSIAGSDPLVWN